MKAAHTPGPWSVRGQAGNTGHGVADSTGRSICSVPSNGTRPHTERNANVTLIAAAPNLFHLCERSLLALEEDAFPMLREQLRNAIAMVNGSES